MRENFLAVLMLLAGALPAAAADKVLFIVAQKDFYFQEYDDPRRALEGAGFQVVVAAPKLADCVPHPDSGQGDASGIVKPAVTLHAAKASDYRALVFIGGWGASMYQYAFAGKYDQPAYNLPRHDKEDVNRLVSEFYASKKTLAAICHGVAALAWSRVMIDGKPRSPLSGKTVTAYEGGGPACTIGGKSYAPNELPSRWHAEQNGATVLAPGTIGDPATDADDVYVDGDVVTAQNFNSAKKFGEVLAQRLKAGKAAR